MPRSLTLRKALAAITMAVAALWGGGSGAVMASEKGTLSVVELRSNAALRPDSRKRIGSFLQNWLIAKGHNAAVAQPRKDGTFAIWTEGDATETLASNLPPPAEFGIHTVARSAIERDIKTGTVEPGFKLIADAEGAIPLVISADPVIGSEGLASARGEIATYSSEPVLAFEFTKAAGEKFATLTREAVGERFAIVVDDTVLSAPVVREPIIGGKGIITGRFTLAEVQTLAERLLRPTGDLSLVVVKTCPAARPRAPPAWLPTLIKPEPACD